MKRLINYSGTKCLSVLAILLFGTGLLCHGHVWGYESSGLTLSIHADPDHTDLKFTLGEAVALIMVISNDTQGPITTDKGFSQVELHHSLIVIDPGGKRHELRQKNEAHKMPPPFFLNDQPWGLAETLPGDWVRSVTIEDLSELIPMMKTTAGWYTIEAQQPFVRYVRTGQDTGLGFLGLLDHTNNWQGTVNSDKIQVYISPARGARLKVQIMDVKNGTATPLGQVPVRVFENTGPANFNPSCDVDSDGDVDQSDLSVFALDCGQTGCTSDCEGDFDNDGDVDGMDLSVFAASFGVTGGFTPESAWSNSDPVVTGTSNFEGWVVWDSDFACLSEGNYVVISYYMGNYGVQPILPGEGVGWNISCEDSIVRKIGFGGSPPDILGDLNGDGCVDRVDYNIIMVEIRGPEPHDPSFDLNGDGAVNIADARYLVTLFTNPQGAPCQE